MLYLDIGNTNVNVYVNDKVFSFNNKENLELEFETFIKGLNFEKKCFVSSVVPDLTIMCQSILQKYNYEVRQLKVADYQNFVDFSHVSYQEMGADRVVVMAAAQKYYGQNVIVFDLGTALTVDVLVAGKYVTGYIFPGLDLTKNSLLSGTALLTDFEFTTLTANDCSLTTNSQLSDGLQYGILGAMKIFIDIATQHFSQDYQVVITGGYVNQLFKVANQEKIDKFVCEEIIVDEELMKKGLLFIAENLEWYETKKY